jgi:hypothetical protein
MESRQGLCEKVCGHWEMEEKKDLLCCRRMKGRKHCFDLRHVIDAMEDATVI